MADEKAIEAMARELCPAVLAGTDYEDVPVDEVWGRPRYLFLKERVVRAATDALAAYRQYQAEAGIVEVPMEPTKAMLTKMKVWPNVYEEISMGALRDAYDDMLAAAQETTGE